MASFEPAKTCEELRKEELDALCEIYNSMVKVVQGDRSNNGGQPGDVAIEGYCQTMLQSFFGMHSSNEPWRMKEAWDYLFKKPIPLSNGRCVICVVKEFDKDGNPCKVVYTTLCEDDDDECPNRYCGWDYVALATAVSKMWAWFYSSGFLDSGNPVAPDGSPLTCPVLTSAGSERVEIGKGAAAMWHPLYEGLDNQDKAKLDKCGPCYDPTFVPEGWDAIIDPETGEACFFSFVPTYEWKEQYVYLPSIEVLSSEDCPDLCPGQTVVINGQTFPVYKQEDGTVAVDLTGYSGPPLQTEQAEAPDGTCVDIIFVLDDKGCRTGCKYYIQFTKTEWGGDPATLIPKEPATPVDPVDPIKVPITTDNDPSQTYGPDCYPLTYGGAGYDAEPALIAALEAEADCTGVTIDGTTACFPAGCTPPGSIVVTCDEDVVPPTMFLPDTAECEASYNSQMGGHINCGSELDLGPFAQPGECGDITSAAGSCAEQNPFGPTGHRILIDATVGSNGDHEVCLDFTQDAGANITSIRLYDSAGNQIPASAVTYTGGQPQFSGVHTDGSEVGANDVCGPSAWWAQTGPGAFNTQVCATFPGLTAGTHTAVITAIAGTECVSNLSIQGV